PDIVDLKPQTHFGAEVFVIVHARPETKFNNRILLRCCFNSRQRRRTPRLRVGMTRRAAGFGAPASSANLTLVPAAGRGIETATNGDVMTCVVTSPDAGRRSSTLTASTVPSRRMLRTEMP